MKKEGRKVSHRNATNNKRIGRISSLERRRPDLFPLALMMEERDNEPKKVRSL